MFKPGMASPEQLATLTKVFDDFATEAGIEGQEARDDLAQKIILLFTSGVTDPDEIRRHVRDQLASRPQSDTRSAAAS